jgi:RsiW-degrading membrane proteinase PrsW (M82 family)
MNLALAVLLVLPLFVAWYLLRYDTGSKDTPLHLIEAFAFGLVAVVLVPLVRGLLWGSLGWDDATISNLLVIAAGSNFSLAVVLIGALLEEAFKFLPLALFIRHKRYFNELTRGVIYFALVGLCVGLFENVAYVVMAERLVPGAGLGIALTRTVFALCLHAAATGIVGYYFARSHILGEGLFKTGIAVVVVSALHALYNYGALMAAATDQWYYLALAMGATLVLNGGLIFYIRRAYRLDRTRAGAGS